MANRRMFSKIITNSSRFLMMPDSAQSLYFHFGMNADDDGFCEHFTIMRMTDSKPDDLRILQARGFVKVFDEKVLIIMDWKENNYIQKDRYTPSRYLQIYKQEIRSICENNKKCIQDVYKTDTQVRIGKVNTIHCDKEKIEHSVSSSVRRRIRKKIKAAPTSLPESSEASEIDAHDKEIAKVGMDVKSVKKTQQGANFDGKKYIHEMLADKQRHIRIISLYLIAKKIEPENKEQMAVQIKRNLRAAKDLMGYENDRIREVIIFLRDFGSKMRLTKWTLETVGKYIDENLENIKRMIQENDKTKTQKVFGENIKI